MQKLILLLLLLGACKLSEKEKQETKADPNRQRHTLTVNGKLADSTKIEITGTVLNVECDTPVPDVKIAYGYTPFFYAKKNPKLFKTNRYGEFKFTIDSLRVDEGLLFKYDDNGRPVIYYVPDIDSYKGKSIELNVKMRMYYYNNSDCF